MHFESPGRENTENTLRLAFERAAALGLNEAVVASSKGSTAQKALEIFQGFQLTVVTYHCGFKQPFENVMPSEVWEDLESAGARVVSGSHALSGVERSVALKHGGLYPALIMAETLRMFGQGTKVAVEIAVMAADAGTLSGRDIVSVGGTGRGADAALILKPAHQNNLFDMRIREIVCKPRDF
jgi:hypothetical protein